MTIDYNARPTLVAAFSHHAEPLAVPMINRRTFLGATGASLFGAPLLFAESTGDEAPEGRRLAVVTTLWNYRSHAWHMAERFLAGYPRDGRWHRPEFKVVSAYVDQRPEGDLSGDRAKEFGFTIYPSVADALRQGTDKLAVDAVLLIGEHGEYPVNEYGQKQYPRYELFSQIADVFRQDGRATPVFNDKHLSWKFSWAKEMVAASRELGFALQGGSSLPVTFRMPAIDLPYGAEVEEALVVAFGPVDIYDFHALETLQCFVERRKGGESGVTTMHALRGAEVWDAFDQQGWQNGGFSPRLFEACLSRSHTLRQGETTSHRYPTPAQMRQWAPEAIMYRFQYADGLKATMLLLNGLVEDFTFAATIQGESEPLSTLVHLPPNPNVVYSAPLMQHAERMFETGKAQYPIERTLLTSGLVEAGLHSLHKKRAIETPHLNIKYQPKRESLFSRT